MIQTLFGVVEQEPNLLERLKAGHPEDTVGPKEIDGHGRAVSDRVRVNWNDWG